MAEQNVSTRRRRLTASQCLQGFMSEMQLAERAKMAGNPPAGRKTFQEAPREPLADTNPPAAA